MPASLGALLRQFIGQHRGAYAAAAAMLLVIALLQVAARSGLIDNGQSAAAQEAYRALRRTQHAIQLAGHDPARAPAAGIALHAAAIDALWQAVIGDR